MRTIGSNEGRAAERENAATLRRYWLVPRQPEHVSAGEKTAIRKEVWQSLRCSWKFWIAYGLTILLTADIELITMWVLGAIHPLLADIGAVAGLVVLGIGLMITGRVARKYRWPVWFDHRICPGCGYDLRATPDQCPECGATRKDL
jgi:hypothetical protein